MALVAGFVAFALLEPEIGIPLLILGLVFEIGEATFWYRYLAKIRVRTGAEGLVGERGSVIEECRPRGRIKVYGEIWTAECAGEGAGEGEAVRITAVDGLTLTVEPAEGGGRL